MEEHNLTMEKPDWFCKDKYCY